MKSLLSDNSGELTTDEFKGRASMISACWLTTASNVPYQNGLHEEIIQLLT